MTADITPTADDFSDIKGDGAILGMRYEWMRWLNMGIIPSMGHYESMIIKFEQFRNDGNEFIG